jgi:predicted N-formylglutamate amidohydrolase
MPRSIPGVATVEQLVRAGPPLLIEIPHGATRTAQFEALRRRLNGPLPADLVDFFHVNTDAGAPELGRAIAEAMDCTVLLIASEIPRTLIDVNRVLDASREEYAEGKVTPGLGPWITDPDDATLLRDLHAQYTHLVDDAMAETMAAGGKALFLHTYGPRTVDVEVGLDIGARMRAAYARPDEWPLRPAMDIIARTSEGELLADPRVVERIVAAGRDLGHEVAVSGTYPLHPTSNAWRYAHAWPGCVVCVEVRRDLVADPFEPFAQMRMSDAAVRAIGGALATALRGWS